MNRRPLKIVGLADWGLSPSALTRLGSRPIEITIQQKGPKISTLFPFPPATRQAKLAASLARGLRVLEKRCPPGVLKVRGDNGLPWTIDARVPANSVVELSRLPSVTHVWVRRISGRRRRAGNQERIEWFAICGRVAVQVEGQVRGYQTVEERIVLLKARSEREARRMATKNWKEYGEPYLNPDGFMVRWELEEIVDVYPVLEEEIDETGIEVFSRIRERRMRPEYEWHPRGRRGRRLTSR